jgi:hypothetical protein
MAHRGAGVTVVTSRFMISATGVRRAEPPSMMKRRTARWVTTPTRRWSLSSTGTWRMRSQIIRLATISMASSACTVNRSLVMWCSMRR